MLKAYQVLSRSDLDNIRGVYPNITIDEYYEALAWAGLMVGSDGVTITNAWEIFTENDPVKADMYLQIASAEKTASNLAASKTKCN